MALPPPPDGLDLGESRVYEVTSALTSTWSLAVVAICLRFLARRLRHTRPWPEDWIIIVSLVASSVHVYTTLGLMIPNGTGRHIWVGPPVATKAWAIGLFISEVAYTLTLSTVKCSTLMFYWRIFGTKKSIRVQIWVLSGMVLAWAIAVLLVTIFQCVPARAFWERYDPVNPMSPDTFTCGVNVNMFFNGNSIPNIITDALVVMLPIPYVLSLQMPRPQKVALLGVFLLGTFVTAISIYRLRLILKVDLKSPDITWNFCDSIIWTNVEANTAIVCACLPSLKPLLSIVVEGTLRSVGSKGDESAGGSSYALSNGGGRFGARRGSNPLETIGGSHAVVKGSPPNNGKSFLGAKAVSQVTVKGGCPGATQDDERPFTRLSEGRSNSSLEEASYNRDSQGKPAIVVSTDFEVKSISRP
ncbi:hypothetical protein LX36DRAFT_752035 [Colletotrichum falcatum]|nr:hypothetical protein LX36DRAFT_752035 [Colletotrichum falcatum]